MPKILNEVIEKVSEKTGLELIKIDKKEIVNIKLDDKYETKFTYQYVIDSVFEFGVEYTVKKIVLHVAQKIKQIQEKNYEKKI